MFSRIEIIKNPKEIPRRMVGNKFCDSQIYAKGDSKMAHICPPDDPQAQLFCAAHLNEARTFPCPYTEKDIYTEGNRKKIAHKSKEGELAGVCEDFEPIEASAQTPPSCKEICLEMGNVKGRGDESHIPGH